MSSGSGHQRKPKAVEKPLFHLDEVPEITEKRDLSTLLPSKWNLLKEIFEREQRVAWREEFYRKQPQETNSLLKVRAGRDAVQAASGRNRSGQIKMQEGHPIHAQCPIPSTLSKHPMENPWVQTSKIKFNGCFGMRWVGWGGKTRCISAVLVESKGIYFKRGVICLSCQPTK